MPSVPKEMQSSWKPLCKIVPGIGLVGNSCKCQTGCSRALTQAQRRIHDDCYSGTWRLVVLWVQQWSSFWQHDVEGFVYYPVARRQPGCAFYLDTSTLCNVLWSADLPAGWKLTSTKELLRIYYSTTTTPLGQLQGFLTADRSCHVQTSACFVVLDNAPVSLLGLDTCQELHSLEVKYTDIQTMASIEEQTRLH